jgi:hypothetical protein
MVQAGFEPAALASLSSNDALYIDKIYKHHALPTELLDPNYRCPAVFKPPRR